MSGAYYNEHDPNAAEWLRELIRRGLIADGEVDTRSIEDVVPTELHGFTQCHFFAGIGVWSYALRLAGVPDDRPLWTGSCPCQPFSPAGKGKGFADERHLWPAFFHLISVCRPQRVYGEQVAGKDGLAWLDLVSTDLEAVGYACGAVPFPAAGIGAPHIRERLYWVADADDAGLEGWRQPGCERAAERLAVPRGVAGGMADHDADGRSAFPVCRLHDAEYHAEPRRDIGRMADDKLQQRPFAAPCGDDAGGWQQEPTAVAGLRGDLRPGPTNGFWRDADWLGCRDDRWRPVEPDTSPLAHGAAARVVRLRGYGNGLVAEQAAEFIRAAEDVLRAAA